MAHPYENRPDRSFWRTGVLKAHAQGQGSAWDALYNPKFKISKDTSVATAGSCFAQHIGKALRGAGVNVLDAEPAPAAMSESLAKRFGYGIYSGRYGNIYTPRQLKELLEDVLDVENHTPLIWQKNGRFYDALRPSVEPEGCDSEEEVRALRKDHLLRVGMMLWDADTFIFTLGLTETWIDQNTGRALPVAPGVLAGDLKTTPARFHNFTYPEILDDLEQILRLLREINPEMQLLLTVSPVPLTATATEDHVLTATQYSKASLRAACGDFVAAHEDVDYFPSYELVTSAAFGAPAFEPNLRSVRAETVAQVMGCFLNAHEIEPSEAEAEEDSAKPAKKGLFREGEDAQMEDDLVCEDLLLDAFAK